MSICLLKFYGFVPVDEIKKGQPTHRRQLIDAMVFGPGGASSPVDTPDGVENIEVYVEWLS